MALAARPAGGSDADSAGSAMTSRGRFGAMPRPSCSGRWKALISAPDSVVGTAAQGSSCAAATALQASITRPPPTASSAAAGRGCSSQAVSASEAASGTGPGGTWTTA